MLRAVIAVIVGYALWTAIWLGGNALVFAEASEVVASKQPYSEPGPLAGILVLSVVCSLVAGAAAGAIAANRGAVAAVVLGALLLVTGIAVQAGVWSLMPVWYHVTFLVLLVPATIAGARLAPRSRAGRRLTA